MLPSPEDNPTASRVLRGLVRQPYARMVRRWNWKSALLSAVIRAAIFFATNLRAGVDAAMGAALAELIFRACTSGFYGVITEAFVSVRPVAVATMTTMVLLPLVAHAVEFLLHALRGTPELERRIAASIAFTSVSTSFTLFAMRHGALITGDGRRSILSDLGRMPVVAFVRSVFNLCTRSGWRRGW
jgi:hypothetical protein